MVPFRRKLNLAGSTFHELPTDRTSKPPGFQWSTNQQRGDPQQNFQSAICFSWKFAARCLIVNLVSWKGSCAAGCIFNVQARSRLAGQRGEPEIGIARESKFAREDYPWCPGTVFVSRETGRAELAHPPKRRRISRYSRRPAWLQERAAIGNSAP